MTNSNHEATYSLTAQGLKSPLYAPAISNLPVLPQSLPKYPILINSINVPFSETQAATKNINVSNGTSTITLKFRNGIFIGTTS